MKILKGLHYGCPFPWPYFYLNKKELTKTVSIRFDESIRYDIGEDQSDVNKLFGFSYGLHHKNSDRIGFRYIKDKDEVEIVLYSYLDGVRKPTQHLYYVKIGDVVNLTLSISLKNNTRKVQTIACTNGKKCNSFYNIYEYNTKKWGYTLGLYFGGNKRAPHTIYIEEI